MLGGILGKDGNHQDLSQQSSSARSGSSGGMTNALRSAARKSGLEDTVENFAGAAFGMLGDRVRQMTDQAFPGVMDKIQNASNKTPETAQDRQRTMADSPGSSSNFAV